MVENSKTPENLPERQGAPELRGPDVQPVRTQIEAVMSVESIKTEAIAAVAEECGVSVEAIPSKADFDSEVWKKLKPKGDAIALLNAANEGIELAEVKRFLAAVVIPHLQISNYTMAYRILKNTKIASPELCAFMGQRAVDSLFVNGGASLTAVDLESQLKGMAPDDLRNAVDRLNALKSSQPIQTSPSVIEVGGEFEDELERVIDDLPLIEISPDISMKEMWDAINGALSDAQYDFIEEELVDQARNISTFLLVDSQSMTMSVREFCERSSSMHPKGFEITLDELEEVLPIKFI